MDNTIDKKSIYNEWIEIANIDYEVGKRIFEERWPKQHITICYHCQQAAEKYIKGYLAYNGEEIVKTHILEDLLDICILYDKSFSTLEKFCIYLTPFAVQIRYPKNNYNVTDIETKKALECTKEIIDFITNKMSNEK